jgi:hypothetical protein
MIDVIMHFNLGTNLSAQFHALLLYTYYVLNRWVVDIITSQDLVVGRKILALSEMRPTHQANLLTDLADTLHICLFNPSIMWGV